MERLANWPKPGRKARKLDRYSCATLADCPADANLLQQVIKTERIATLSALIKALPEEECEAYLLPGLNGEINGIITR
jgi:hypothetical protein